MKGKKIKLIYFLFFLILLPGLVIADDEINETDLKSEEIIETISASANTSKEPTINARHAIIFDRNSKQTLYGKEEEEKCKMASTTKIMTAIIVIENTKLTDIVTISKKSAQTGGSRLGLSTNDKLTVENLLYGLMLKSGNDAAVALAEHTGGNIENFALMMNKKAKDLQLSSTNFVTPHGLDSENHYTTALDLARLADYALQNETFAKIVKTKTYTLYINNSPKTISNTNELLGNFDGIYGVKTGFTNGANRCLVTACKRGAMDVICIVFGCDTKKDRTKDSIKLLNYIFQNYSVVNIKDILTQDFDNWLLTHSNSFYINKGVSDTLNLYLDEPNFEFTHIAVKNTAMDKIHSNISCTNYFEAPVNTKSKVGEISLSIDNNTYFSVDILSKTTINKKNFLCYITYFFKQYCNFFIIEQIGTLKNNLLF